MKITLLLILLNIFLSSAYANTAVLLSCTQRQSVIIARFGYGLSTMKWDDNFIVASGIEKTRTESGIPFRITHFTNGDNLVFFPENQRYFFQYADVDSPDRCQIMKTFSYPVAKLPYEKSST
ncbi:hypothetical protein [Citrobacter braakii]|uniref:hypothetical protein n=1 Tax=Citrobacter braakii TaxID=57706 RepID=UPI0040390D7D